MRAPDVIPSTVERIPRQTDKEINEEINGKLRPMSLTLQRAIRDCSISVSRNWTANGISIRFLKPMPPLYRWSAYASPGS